MEQLQLFINVWSYLSVGGTNQKCDIVFVLGRDDFSIPEKTLDLYKKGLVSKIFLLGGRGRLTGNIYGSESEAFKRYLVSKGVPAECVFLEENSTNTGENIAEGLKLLKINNITPDRIGIITHGPHMRRSLAVAKAQNYLIEWLPCPDFCTLPDMNSSEMRKVAEELVGELSRLEEYPKFGYFEKQDIPKEILSARSLILSWLNK